MSLHIVTPQKGLVVVGASKPSVKAVKSGKSTILFVTKKAA